jgi:hypothetical protein
MRHVKKLSITLAVFRSTEVTPMQPRLERILWELLILACEEEMQGRFRTSATIE